MTNSVSFVALSFQVQRIEDVDCAIPAKPPGAAGKETLASATAEPVAE